MVRSNGRGEGVAPDVSVVGIGIDTARYGHYVVFLRDNEQPAVAPLTVRESREGYDELSARLEEVRRRYPNAQLRLRIDAAGPYARNLEQFLRNLPLELSISVGEPLRNHHYCKAHKPKEKSDRAEAYAMARYALRECPRATFFAGAEFTQLQVAASRLQSAARDLTRAINRLHNLLSNVFPELAVEQKDLSAKWVLQLLDKWPTPQRLIQAGLARLQKIPYLSPEKAEVVLARARTSVASLRGEVAEQLVRVLVGEVRHLKEGKESLEELVRRAYRNLPPGNYHQLPTIKGLGELTAAVLTSKIVDIDRFDTPEKLVGYFGVFPEVVASGFERDGQPHLSHKTHMSSKGNDLVRGYLWMAAFSAISTNPPVRAQYARLRSNGVNGNVAIGHAMQKLLHQVWAIWRSGEAYDPERHLRRSSSALDAAPPETAETAEMVETVETVETAETAAAPGEPNKMAAGLTREPSPPMPEVTTASVSVSPAPPVVNVAPPAASRRIDFAHVRSQLPIETVLKLLNHRQQLNTEGRQLRGPCPFHQSRRPRPRHFSVNTEKQVFQCFAPECQAKGNALDLYAQAKRLPIHDAAWQLVEILGLQPTVNRERNP